MGVGSVETSKHSEMGYQVAFCILNKLKSVNINRLKAGAEPLIAINC